jgi:hypothetical protein
MSKFPPSPFDDFPSDGTPLLFLDRMNLAFDWIEPYLTPGNVQQDLFLAYCQGYERLMNEFPFGDETKIPDAIQQLIMKQQLVVSTFHKSRDAIMASKAIERVADQDKAQSTRASKLRSIDETDARQIAKRYYDAKQKGSVYGVVKELAARYGVTEKTIKSATDRYKPDSIA